MTDDVASIHTDGAARGNPGPAACAFVIARPGHPPVEHAERLGETTNNVAEYTALVRALARAAELGLKRLAVYSDSELMVKQMNGEYGVKSADLRELYTQAQSLQRHFDSATFTHVRRAENRRADELCNAVLDGRPPSGPRPTPAGKPRPRKRPAPARSAAVDDQAVACLRAAAAAWRHGDAGAPSPEQVWEQLWSALEEGGVLKARRAK